MSIKKSPAGAATPDGETTNNFQSEYTTSWPRKASVDQRCWHCERFRTERCNGLIDYHWRDCPMYRRR